MCTLASSALRALRTSSQSHAYDLSARQCVFAFKRHFRASPRILNQDDPAKGTESAWNHLHEDATTTSSDTSDTAQEQEGAVEDANGSQTPSRPKDLSGYGSAARRAGRHVKKPPELPQLILPAWFLASNVFLREELSNLAIPTKELEPKAGSFGKPIAPISTDPEPAGDSTAAGTIPNRDDCKAEDWSSFYRITSNGNPYYINKNVLHEIASLTRIGLESALIQTPERWMSSKADLLLYHPKNGGTFFLDDLVSRLAATYSADLICLGPQDIASIGGNYVDECKDTHVKSLSTLGYDVYAPVSTGAALEDAQNSEEESEEDSAGEGDEEDDNRDQHKTNRFGASSIGFIPISQGGRNLMDLVRSAIASRSPFPHNLFRQQRDLMNDAKVSSFFETTLNASEKNGRSAERLRNSSAREWGQCAPCKTWS